jgi:hypothetical protein
VLFRIDEALFLCGSGFGGVSFTTSHVNGESRARPTGHQRPVASWLRAPPSPIPPPFVSVACSASKSSSSCCVHFSHSVRSVQTANNMVHV